jgi:N-acetylmuramoyl-L-alanine amidase
LTRFFFNERDGGGWKTGGYHWIIERDGRATRIYSDDISTNGALGLNQESIHLNWIGGYSKKGEPLNFNIEKGQIFTLKQLINRYIETYPDIKVLGHNQVSNKPCPLFNVPTFCDGIGIDDENIERGIISTNSGFYSKWNGVVLKDEARRIALLV